MDSITETLSPEQLLLCPVIHLADAKSGRKQAPINLPTQRPPKQPATLELIHKNGLATTQEEYIYRTKYKEEWIPMFNRMFYTECASTEIIMPDGTVNVGALVCAAQLSVIENSIFTMRESYILETTPLSAQPVEDGKRSDFPRPMHRCCACGRCIQVHENEELEASYDCPGLRSGTPQTFLYAPSECGTDGDLNSYFVGCCCRIPVSLMDETTHCGIEAPRFPASWKVRGPLVKVAIENWMIDCEEAIEKSCRPLQRPHIPIFPDTRTFCCVRHEESYKRVERWIQAVENAQRTKLLSQQRIVSSGSVGGKRFERGNIW